MSPSCNLLPSLLESSISISIIAFCEKLDREIMGSKTWYNRVLNSINYQEIKTVDKKIHSIFLLNLTKEYDNHLV